MVGRYKVVTLCGSTRFKDEFMKDENFSYTTNTSIHKIFKTKRIQKHLNLYFVFFV